MTPPMTSPADLSNALQRIWTVLATAPWTTRPDQAERDLAAARADLLDKTSRLDPEAWPRAVRTYLWRPPEPSP